MRARCLLLVLSVAALAAFSGCAQSSWPKLTNPFQSASAAAPTADPGGLSAGNGSADSLKNPMAMARLSERQGRSEQAERLYLDLANRSPNDPEPQHRLGVLYTKQGRFKEAGDRFARALTISPNHPELLNDAGYHHYLAGNRAEAERCLRRALELQPENSRVATNLALVVGEQGRDDECLALLRRAAPMGNQAYMNFAYMLAQRGEYARAMEIYDRVLTEDPSKRVAADAVVELSRYAPRRTQLPPPVIPSGRLPQVAQAPAEQQVPAAQPANVATPLPAPGASYPQPPMPSTLAAYPPQPSPSAWAAGAAANAAQPGFPPAAANIPAYAPGLGVASPVSYQR